MAKNPFWKAWANLKKAIDCLGGHLVVWRPRPKVLRCGCGLDKSFFSWEKTNNVQTCITFHWRLWKFAEIHILRHFHINFTAGVYKVWWWFSGLNWKIRHFTCAVGELALMLQAMETAFPASLLFHVGTINVPPNINLDYIIMWEPSMFLQPQPLHIFDCFSLFLSFSFYILAPIIISPQVATLCCQSFSLCSGFGVGGKDGFYC